MELITKPNKRFRFLLCVTDICSKYVWVVLLKYEKGITITSNFQNILDELKCNPNKRWIDKSSEFYNRSITTWPGKNNIEMYSPHHEGKSVIAEDSLEP